MSVTQPEEGDDLANSDRRDRREIVALRSPEQARRTITQLLDQASHAKPSRRARGGESQRMSSANAERQRRYRERQKQQGASNGPILFTSEDWQLFTQRNTLAQKAGCQPNQIGRVILSRRSRNQTG